MSIQVGQTICHGKYQILALAGEGSFARVWQARQPGFDNLIVAIKELKRDELTTEQLRESERRFRREISLARALLEAKALSVVLALTLDRLPESGVPLLVLEYMPGGDLADRIEQQRAGMPVIESLSITLALCRALSAFHSLPVLPVHRDIKPSNVLFSASGDAHLADFGLAQLPGESLRSYGTGGHHPGTPLYMSPEQDQSVASLQPASDIYALGCLLFEMLTGEPYGRHVETLVGAMRPELAGSKLEQVLAKALAEKWQQRYQRAGELAAVLQPLRAELVAASERAARIEGIRRQAERARKTGRFAAARHVVDAWLVLAPDDEEARTLRMRIAAEEEIAILESQIAAQRQEFENGMVREDWPAAHAALQKWGQLMPDDAQLRVARRRLVQTEAWARRRDQISALRSKAEAALAAGNWCRARRTAQEWGRLEPNSEAMRAVVRAAEQLRAGQAGSICLPLIDRPVPTRLAYGVPVFLFVAISLISALNWYLTVYLPEREEAIAATATAIAIAEATDEAASAAATGTAFALTETALASTATVETTEPTHTPRPDTVTPPVPSTPDTPTPTKTPTPWQTPTSTQAPRPTATSVLPPGEAGLGDTWIRPADGMTMVYVPAGSFMMGSEEGDLYAYYYEFPQHEVKLDSFWIDETEVTNAQFELFVRDTGHETTAEQEGWSHASTGETWSERIDGADWQHPAGLGSDLAGLAQYPVLHVSWYDAEAYCEWAGGRLPTEAEWEYAARGPEANHYPWGDEFYAGTVNFCDANCPFAYALDAFDDGFAQTAPAGTYPDGASWAGVLDMAGNVEEWVQDWYIDDYYEISPAENPAGPLSGYSKALRGGNWASDVSSVRSAYRGPNQAPGDRAPYIGFRCAIPTDGERAEGLSPSGTPYPADAEGTSREATDLAGAAEDEPNAPPESATLGDTWLRPADGMTMVYVPGGTFLMGSAEGDTDVFDREFPQHEVTLDSFWIDQTEVTNAQYERCVAEGDCAASSYADDATFNGSDHPVVGVSWDVAVDYCAWVGGRLPTEAEWEYAARGPEENRYPWGDNEPTCDLAQYYGCDGATLPVGTLPVGASWVGSLDMAGNVWEWVQDWYESDYYRRSPGANPTGPPSGANKVLRGGGWGGNSRDVRSAYRGSYAPGASHSPFGFRCAIPTDGERGEGLSPSRTPTQMPALASATVTGTVATTGVTSSTPPVSVSTSTFVSPAATSNLGEEGFEVISVSPKSGSSVSSGTEFIIRLRYSLLGDSGTLTMQFIGSSLATMQSACDSITIGDFYLSSVYSFPISKGSRELTLTIPPEGRAGPDIGANINYLTVEISMYETSSPVGSRLIEVDNDGSGRCYPVAG